jgi:hypothetical protein
MSSWHSASLNKHRDKFTFLINLVLLFYLYTAFILPLILPYVIYSTTLNMFADVSSDSDVGYVIKKVTRLYFQHTMHTKFVVLETF